MAHKPRLRRTRLLFNATQYIKTIGGSTVHARYMNHMNERVGWSGGIEGTVHGDVCGDIGKAWGSMREWRIQVSCGIKFLAAK